MGRTPFTSFSHLTITKLGTAKLAVATTALIVGGGTGLASVGALPAPAQTAASHALVLVGVEVPDPSAQLVDTGEAEERRHSTDDFFNNLRLGSMDSSVSAGEDRSVNSGTSGLSDDQQVEDGNLGNSGSGLHFGGEDHPQPEDVSDSAAGVQFDDNPHPEHQSVEDHSSEDHSSEDQSSEDHSSDGGSSDSGVDSPRSATSPREEHHSDSPEPTAPANNVDDSSGGGSGSGRHGGSDDASQPNT
ncbi:unannotated protein [freshwater metagenome]|uniref:Unannotated protein n=1 Tax=freshwater metagenome TaxID=449393 RepID=A0A6J7HJC1_9ZZZZ|nr:hypothetical protein [Actinomycetota bacterium]